MYHKILDDAVAELKRKPFADLFKDELAKKAKNHCAGLHHRNRFGNPDSRGLCGQYHRKVEPLFAIG